MKRVENLLFLSFISMNSLKIKTESTFAKVMKAIIISLVVLIVAFTFISKKANLDIDEFYTYGLANNTFQLDIENYKEYTGEELLLNYAAAHEGHLFDAKNVFFNQKMDTHPPLYFLLVNFISSMNKNKFSMWYGLSINLIFLIVLFWLTRYLLCKIIKNETMSSILTLIALTLYGFINNYAFTRMYVMLSAMSLLFVSLVLNYTDAICYQNFSENASAERNTAVSTNKVLNFKFLILFYIICVIGVLTHYHFMLVAGFFSVFLAVNLIKKKDYCMLIATFVSGVISILTAVLIFPAMISHIFGGGNSAHSLNSFAKVSTFAENLSVLISGIYKEFFGTGIIAYIILIVVGIFILFASKKLAKKSIKEVVFDNYLYFTFLLFVVIYYFIICCTVRLSFTRYLYNIYPLIFIVIISPIYLLFAKNNKYLAFIPIVLMCILSITSKYKHSPTQLNVEDAQFIDYLDNFKDTKMILLYRTVDEKFNKNSTNTSIWKLPTPLYLFKNMKNMTFVDISNEEAIASFSNKTIEGYDDILLVIYTFEDDDKYIKYIMEKNNVTNCSKLYFTTYFHVYRLN